MTRQVLEAIVSWLRARDKCGVQTADTRVSYPTRVAERSAVGPIASTVPQLSPTYKAERYDYTRQAWIGTDGRYLCCAHLPEHGCQCYGRLHVGELAQGAALPTTLEERVNKRMQELGQAVASAVPARPPTINSWPVEERRGYDAYVRELAYLEHVLAEERKGRYGRQADEDVGDDDEDVRCVDDARTADDIVSDLDEQRRRAWEQEVDELYEREELERLQRLDDERKADL